MDSGTVSASTINFLGFGDTGVGLQSASASTNNQPLVTLLKPGLATQTVMNESFYAEVQAGKFPFAQISPSAGTGYIILICTLEAA
jgi:hypothetical protein